MIRSPEEGLSFREERKFVIPRGDCREIEGMIRISPAMFSESFPPRWVNSIYLDTYDFLNHTEHLAGVRDRAKHRVRWYGSLRGKITSPILEEKMRFSILGAKRRCRLPEFNFDGRISSSILHSKLREGEVDPRILEVCLKKILTIVTRYRRKYFVSRDGRYRVTIDWGLEYYGVQAGGCGFRRGRKESIVIVELKYDPEFSDDVHRVVSKMPFRIVRNSKYMRGVSSIYGIE